jgi:pimeloyl-ACP methyl ester carboxylesterase
MLESGMEKLWDKLLVGSEAKKQVCRALLTNMVTGGTEVGRKVIGKLMGKLLEQKPELATLHDDGVFEVKVDYRQLLGSQSPLLEFLREYGMAADTPACWMVRLTEAEAQEWRAGRLANVKIWEMICQSQEVLSLGHGFSGSRDAWVPDVAELLGEVGLVKQRVAVAWSTKGAEGTVLERRVGGGSNGVDEGLVVRETGGMRDGAAQIEIALRCWGLLGSNEPVKVVHLGHSMGGREAMLLPMLAGLRSKLKVIPIAPVMIPSVKHLLLMSGADFRGMLQGLVLRLAYDLVPRVKQIANWGAIIGKETGLTKVILDDLVQSGDREQMDQDKVDRVVAVHAQNFTRVEEIFGQLKQLLKEPALSRSLIGLLSRKYNRNVAGILAGGADRILRTSDMTAGLGQVWGNKFQVVEGAPHHVWMTRPGMTATMGVINQAYS